MKSVEVIKSLIKRLNEASIAYYNSGNTIMTDYEYDAELKKLKALELETGIIMSNSPTQTVGAPVLTKLEKIKHEGKAMLSLEKVHNAAEILKFANGQKLVAMTKLDGLSTRLTYENGKLTKGETRGNGLEGSNIIEHVKQFKNVPLSINKTGTYVIDGEAVILDDDFEAINAALPDGVEKYKNSRNLASGTLSLLDTSLVKERRLNFIAWDVITGSDYNSFTKCLDQARELGFSVVNVIPLQDHTSQNVSEINELVLNDAKDNGYPCDGVVWKFDDVKYGDSLGQTSHHFCNAVAFKPAQDEYETVLRDIQWSIGKTGQLTPVAIFDPVEIDGTDVERASVHNVSMVKDLKLGIGDTITVYKANMIIPQIAENLTGSDTLEVPRICPICSGKTEIIKENDTEVLICTNESCQGKLLGRLSHFASKNAINIDGMSEATIEFMITELGVKSFKDLYYIPFIPEIEKKWKNSPGFGSKSVDKLLAAIEKSRETTLDRFLYAQSIPLIGRTASKDISKFCNGSCDNFVNMMVNYRANELLKIDGFGETMYNSLMSWFDSHWLEFLALKKEFNFIAESNQNNNKANILEGKTFVITGSLEHFKNRDELTEKIISLGGKVSGSVSAKTTALINNDVNSTSGKNAKAKSLNIPILSEEDFIKMIGEI